MSIEETPASQPNPMVTPQSTFHEKLLDSLYDGVYFVDLNRKILYWNRGAELLTGFPRKR